MKKRVLSAVCAAAMSVTGALSCFPMMASAANPLAQNVYTSDPAPMVDGDTIYVYTGHDKDGADYYYMPDWKCYSTKDMQNYTDHGTVLSWNDFTWAEEDTAWAAQTVKRGDKYYMYVTLVPHGGGRAIGVAVADRPEGPFKDALGKPLCGPNWDFIDPTVFIDDDGQAYLYFGNPRLYYVKLNEDMISYSGDINKIDMTTDAFGKKDDHTTYTEGPWFYKRGDLYYMLYAANGVPEDIRYSTSSSPTGPWNYRGVIMPKQGGSFTNHCGVVDFKGHSYFYYHNGALPGGNGFQRSVCAEEFSYNPDGSIPEINMTKQGPKQIESVNPFIRQEAEMMSWSEGIETEKIDVGGLAIGFIEKGDYVKVSGVDFGEGADKFTASVSSNGSGGVIEIHLDEKNGPIVGTAKVPVTGGWQTWEEVTGAVSGATGEHDVYFVFNGGESYLFNVDWWKFDGAGDPDPEVPVVRGDVN
ncbi:MAG: family 43 glycosylhydrolase, partial [Oscillospiraceae bacterium]|nr:family 43 glycosylhydrolase [Oscillospiraceae bacterium]